MSQLINVTNPLTALAVTELNVNVVAAQAIVDLLKISLTPAQIKSLLSVATNREALIKALYSQIMLLFPATMPTGMTPAAFVALTQEENDSITMAALYTGLATIFLDHAAIIKNNRMFISIQTLDNAKLMGKTDTALNTAVKAFVKEFYGRTPPKLGGAYTVPVSGSFELGGIRTGKQFVNTGESILTFLNVNGDVAKTIRVNPGTGALVPARWTSIVITNLSTTGIGTFEVFLK